MGYEYWNFLKDWNNLDKELKLKKYDEFACHEINLFLYFKDKQLFEDVVKPFINNKIQKTVVDHFLLGNVEEILQFSQI